MLSWSIKLSLLCISCEHSMPSSNYSTTIHCFLVVAATQKPNLEQLEVELRHVRGWVHLGLCLHLPKHSLDEIHASHMLAMWLKRSKNPTWSAFIAALLDARLWNTASKIAAKYGECAVLLLVVLLRFPHQ